ncbi:MAG: hypothetical protein KatS3mg087_0575 [Patescibacteria group bacterium]|nr:MAG: hypothetical protein KatS3mg087_0575 [Patescibacteria group bacterium]
MVKLSDDDIKFLQEESLIIYLRKKTLWDWLTRSHCIFVILKTEANLTLRLTSKELNAIAEHVTVVDTRI